MKCKMILQQYYRLNEQMKKSFSVLFDDESTRAIPAITDTSKFDNVNKQKKLTRVQVKKVTEPVKRSGRNGQSSLEF